MSAWTPAEEPARPAEAAGGVPTGTPDPSSSVPAARVRAVRVRTVVFGLVVLAISVVTLVSLVSDVRVDRGAVALVLLIAAGAALVAGGLGAAVREARGGPGA
jgi:hypothetical protein